MRGRRVQKGMILFVFIVVGCSMLIGGCRRWFRSPTQLIHFVQNPHEIIFHCHRCSGRWRWGHWIGDLKCVTSYLSYVGKLSEFKIKASKIDSKAFDCNLVIEAFEIKFIAIPNIGVEKILYFGSFTKNRPKLRRNMPQRKDMSPWCQKRWPLSPNAGINETFVLFLRNLLLFLFTFVTEF